MTYHDVLISMLLLVILAPWLLHKLIVAADWLGALVRPLLLRQARPPKRSGASS